MIASVKLEYKGAERFIKLYRPKDGNLFIDYNNDGETSPIGMKTSFDGLTEVTAIVDKVYKMKTPTDNPNYEEKAFVIFSIPEIVSKLALTYQRLNFQFEGTEEMLLANSFVHFNGNYY